MAAPDTQNLLTILYCDCSRHLDEQEIRRFNAILGLQTEDTSSNRESAHYEEDFVENVHDMTKKHVNIK